MSNFENKFNQNHSIDIGKIIDESFTTFKKTIWISGVAVLLMCFVEVPIMVFAIFKFLDISTMEDFVKVSPTLGEDFNYLLLNAAVALPLAMITAPFIAGFYKINHLAKQGKEFSLNNFFEYYKGSHFKHLVLSAFLVVIYSNILGLGLNYLKLPVVGTIIQLLVSFLFILSVPLIIFENQTALTAMSNSSKLAMKHPFTIILCLVFAFIIAMLGLFAFCIGILFTISYIYCMNYTLYSHIIPIENNNPIDEIGQE